MLKEEKIFEILQKDENLFDPFLIREIKREFSFQAGTQVRKLDGGLILNFREREYKLAVEVKSRTAPKIVETGINQLKVFEESADYKGEILTVLVPYLTESIVEMLEEKNLSGIDLNGNYYLISDELVAIRLDKKNRYRESKSIRDIYSKKSSIVGRLLLKKPEVYSKINDVYEKILEFGGNLTLSTVSKVLSEMDRELIISKNNKQVRLLQPEKLIEKLSSEYQKPNYNEEVRVKLPGSQKEASKILNDYFGANWILTGESSAELYTSVPKIPESKIYIKTNDVKLIKEFRDRFGDERFYNYTILSVSESEDFVFFDSQKNYASKIQTYLELAQLDKREKEIAEDIKKDILNAFK